MTKTITNTTPAAASGLWRAFPAILELKETVAVDIAKY
jgi:hypothetical protein